MDIPSLLTYEESERGDRSRLTSMKRRGHGSFQVGARMMVHAQSWKVVSFVTNGCAAHHSGHVLTDLDPLLWSQRTWKFTSTVARK